MQKLNTIIFLLLALPIYVSAQCIQGNCQEGFGVTIYQDYTTYIGRFDNFKANGYGTCYYTTGENIAEHGEIMSFTEKVYTFIQMEQKNLVLGKMVL